MSSGSKNLVINTRERAVSTDINRLQSLAQSSLAEVVRWMMLGVMGVDGADPVPPTSTNSPLTAIIMGGFLVTPQIGGTSLSIGAGEAYVCDPDVPLSPDDSPVHEVRDPGLAAGTLTLTPNAGPGTRIDIVECQRTPTVVETSSRDIYDPTTGTFSPVLVNKVVAQLFTYRIRTGAPGGGFPGTVAGWLPLAVFTVPAGAPNFDTCMFWDVRPLASDAALPPFEGQSTRYNELLTADLFPASAATNAPPVAGTIDAVMGQFKAGGTIKVSDPLRIVGDGSYRDISDGALVPGGGYPGSNPQFWCIYLAMPYGLPRWMEYTPSSSGARVPNGLRGIPIASYVGPIDYTGEPAIAINSPPYTLLPQLPAASLMCVGVGSMHNGPGQQIDAMICRDGEFYYGSPAFVTSIGSSSVVVVDLNDTRFLFPANAREVEIQSIATFTMASLSGTQVTGNLSVTLNAPSPVSTQQCEVHENGYTLNALGGGGGASSNMQRDNFNLQIAPQYPTVPGPVLTRSHTISYTDDSTGSSNPSSVSEIIVQVIRVKLGSL